MILQKNSKKGTSLDKSSLSREIQYLKSKMKEHFRFFDNHSPQLKKKRKAGSHSPPKKNSNSRSQLKQDKNGKIRKSMAGANPIFATTDSRRPASKIKQN